MKLADTLEIMGHPQLQLSPTGRILRKLNHVIAEEEGAPLEAFAAAQEIVGRTHIPSALAAPEIETDSEELDLTWQNNGKTVKLVSYPQKPPKVYCQIDADNVFTRGQLLPADPAILSEKLDWLLS